MKSLLIADTTREEREQIVTESIGNIDGLCDGCGPCLLRMCQEYIDGRMELREVNTAFRARYVSGAEGPLFCAKNRRIGGKIPGFDP